MALVAPVQDGKVTNDKIASDKEKKAEEKGKLGYDQFLQLLCAEMQYQDPLEPTSNTDYVAQLATFSQVEATLNMQSALQSSVANDLVGKYVLIKDSGTNGINLAEGYVDYVEYDNGEQYLYINGNKYSVADVYQVIDGDYMEATTLASAFEAAVAKLPDPSKLTVKDVEAVKNLATVYGSLSAYQKQYISSDTLKKYNELLEQANKLLGNTSGGDKDETEGTGGTEGSGGSQGAGGTEGSGGSQGTEGSGNSGGTTETK